MLISDACMVVSGTQVYLYNTQKSSAITDKNSSLLVTQS